MAITPQSTVSNKTAIDLARVLGATPQQIAGLTSSLSSPQATKATIAAGQASPTGQIYPTSPTNLTVSAPSTISSTTTGNPTSINLPPPPTYSNPGQVNNGGLINGLAPTYKLNTATNMFEQVPVTDTGDSAKNEANARFQSFKDRLGLIPQKENVLQSPEILAQQAEVQKMKQEVNNYTSQLNSVIAKQNQDLLSLRETGSKEGVTEAVYGGQQATINREAAIKALPLQAAISAAQGNLQLAQDYLSQLTAIKTEAVNNTYQYKMAQYEAISGFLTKEETIRMEALKEKRTQEREDRLNNISAQENWSKIALQNGQSGLMVSINALDPNSPTFRSSLSAITSGIVDQGAATEKLQQERLRADISKINADAMKLKTEADQLAKNSGGISNDLIAYANNFSDTGKLPSPAELKLSGLNVGQVTELAKQTPKPNGALVSINTGVKPTSLSPAQEDGIIALNEIVNKTIPDLKDRFSKLTSAGITGRVGAFFYTSQDRQDYRTFRADFLAKLLQSRSGGAVTEQEYQRYADMVPSELSNKFIVGAISDTGTKRLNSLADSMKATLDSKLNSQQLSIYGYSKVKVGGEERTVGDILDIGGVKYRILPDGKLTNII